MTEFVHLFLHQCKLSVKNDTKVTNCTGKWDVTLTATHIDERESISEEEPVKKRKKERRKKEELFYRHLSEVYSELSRPSYLNYPDLHI